MVKIVLGENFSVAMRVLVNKEAIIMDGRSNKEAITVGDNKEAIMVGDNKEVMDGDNNQVTMDGGNQEMKPIL